MEVNEGLSITNPVAPVKAVNDGEIDDWNKAVDELVAPPLHQSSSDPSPNTISPPQDGNFISFSLIHYDDGLNLFLFRDFFLRVIIFYCTFVS